MKLSGWGRYPVIDAQRHAPRTLDALRELVLTEPNLIARGNGRAYGDSAINPSATIETRHLNRMIAFDPACGQLVAEAGVQLGEIITSFLPRGWFPLVTPGTKFVTIGGAIAADVHGKNHHKDGSFRACVDWVDVMGRDGEVRRCSARQEEALFDHTIGGMGLTGIILRAAIRLRPVETGWIRQTTIPAPDLKAAMAAFEAAQDVTYSVAWIDCLGTGARMGRSLVMLGEHARSNELSPRQTKDPFPREKKGKLTIPIDGPRFALNGLTVSAFSSFYYWAGTCKTGETLVDWDSYFYPLDAILGWNRIYGRRGFAQFQCAIPLDSAEVGLEALLAEIAKDRTGSFLAVLKRFGKQDGAFSFPLEGYTLALDFPIKPSVFPLLERLDAITIAHGGRFYLAKDSRMSAQTLRASDPRVADFRAYRESAGFNGRFRSAQSERLDL
jgi:FAD/FMN-containing dehydrogenase